MEIRYHRTGSERKALVRAMEEVTGTRAAYRGAPSFSFELGQYLIDREGTVTATCEVTTDAIDRLMTMLALKGFEGERVEQESAGETHPTETHANGSSEIIPVGVGSVAETGTEAAELLPDHPDRLTISLPRDMFTDIQLSNLRKLIAGKESLIRKSLGVDALPVVEVGNQVRFPWFPADACVDDISVYTVFIAKLGEKARSVKRVTAIDRHPENEKYVFRVFLMRLGMVGREYTAARKLLLRKLSGNTAFHCGYNPKGRADRPGG